MTQLFSSSQRYSEDKCFQNAKVKSLLEIKEVKQVLRYNLILDIYL